jgi:starvation-inducible DNA-binding protein
MYRTRNDLPYGVRENMVEVLNRQLADLIDLRTQAKVAHWNIKGPQFAALHELFDDIAESVDKYADLVAERAAQLGGVVRGTAREVAANTELPEYSALGGMETHVAALADALSTAGASARKLIEETAEARDHVTADLFTQLSHDLDKALWMLEAHLQEEEDVSRLQSRNESAIPAS